MSKPIEILHTALSTKFSSLGKAVEIVNNPDLSNNFTTIHTRWQTGFSIFMMEHCKSQTDEAKELAARRYMTWVKSENFLGKMQAIHAEIAETKNPAISSHLNRFNQAVLENIVKKIDYKLCRCGERMTIYPATSELICGSCGCIVSMQGTVPEESSNEGHTLLIKRGRHETNRHCKQHLERILALKPVEIKQTQRDKIEDWIRKNVENKNNMSCATFRRCLKEIKETKLNEYIPYVRQQIVGITPEGLTDAEQKRVHILFDKVVSAISESDIKNGNMRYYPFFIFKILEIILDKPQDLPRLRSIVDCIHFQRDDTIVQNDKIWHTAWQKVSDLNCKPFKKTDPNIFRL